MKNEYIGAPGDNEIGKKFDTDKLRWDLLPFDSVEEIVDVLTYGASKYGPFNWKQLDDAQSRYFAALMRHLSQWKQGEMKDQETGISHLAHAGANLLFLIHFNNKENE